MTTELPKVVKVAEGEQIKGLFSRPRVFVPLSAHSAFEILKSEILERPQNNFENEKSPAAPSRA